MLTKTIFILTLAFSLPMCSLVLANQTDSVEAHKSFEKIRFLPQNYGSKERDASLVLMPETLLKMVGTGQEYLLVDVRLAAAHQAVRIPGSINMALHEIKTKKFLRDKFLILVNHGSGYRKLERTCQELIEDGFSRVAILEGGLNNWQAHGGKIEGDPLAIETVDQITAQDFFQDAIYDDWTIVALGQPDNASPAWFNDTETVTGTREIWPAKAIASFLAQPGRPSQPYILVVTDNGENLLDLKQQIAKAEQTNVFFLKGGMEAYQSFIESQARMGNRKTKEPQCGLCP